MARAQDRPRVLRLPAERLTARSALESDPAPTPGRIDVALAIPLRAGRYLVARRAVEQHLGGTWEFPGGKVEAGEDPAAAAVRELAEETGLVAGIIEPLAVLVHDYRELPLRLHAFLAREPAGEPRLDGDREWAWKSYEELLALDMPAANAPLLKALGWRR